MSINPFGWLQDLVGELPELVQPLLVAVVGAIPFIDEAASGLGIVAGMHPVVAFTANVVGSTLAVVLVVLLGSRVREAVVLRRARRGVPVQEPKLLSVGSKSGATNQDHLAVASDAARQHAAADKESKGTKRLAGWLTRYGVPGASVLAPLAVPFAFTALFFIGAGVSKGWVILWQTVAIVVWAAAVTVSATAAVAVLGY
ncbi:small multidrug efflux protein [Lacisediminihabitans sp. FW035]